MVNLNQMEDFAWVNGLSKAIAKNTETYNAGKYRGDIFYMSYF